MDDQPNTPPHPAPSAFAHLALRDSRTEKERQIADFNERQRRRGSRKQWHDYWPEDSANDPTPR